MMTSSNTSYLTHLMISSLGSSGSGPKAIHTENLHPLVTSCENWGQLDVRYALRIILSVRGQKILYWKMGRSVILAVMGQYTFLNLLFWASFFCLVLLLFDYCCFFFWRKKFLFICLFLNIIFWLSAMISDFSAALFCCCFSHFNFLQWFIFLCDCSFYCFHLNKIHNCSGLCCTTESLYLKRSKIAKIQMLMFHSNGSEEITLPPWM